MSIRSSFFSTFKKSNLSTKFCQSRYFVLVKAIKPSSICCMVSWDLPLILPVTLDDGFNPVFLWWYIFVRRSYWYIFCARAMVLDGADLQAASPTRQSHSKSLSFGLVVTSISRQFSPLNFFHQLSL